MRVALMIPCYVDPFYPETGIAALELLEKLSVDVVYPPDHTCCGQPMANSGCYEEAQATEELFIRNFSAFDQVEPAMAARFGGSVLPPMEHLGHAATRFDPYAAEDSSVCIVSRSVSPDCYWHATCSLL